MEISLNFFLLKKDSVICGFLAVGNFMEFGTIIIWSSFCFWKSFFRFFFSSNLSLMLLCMEMGY